MTLRPIHTLLLSAALMLLLVGCGGDMGYPNDKAAVTTGISTKIKQATVHEPDWEYIGFTHTPVDFQQLMAKESLCASYPPLQPFFNYFVPSHAEGPKKWYLATCLETPVKVFVPAKALLRKGGIRVNTDQVTGGNEGAKTVYDGHNVLSDVLVYFYPSVEVTVFFQHLTLLEQIQSLLDDSPLGLVLEAGTHIGYLKTPDAYGSDHHIIDFGVQDKQVDGGLTEYDDYWWDMLANPFDYFTEESKRSILDAYQPVYDRMVAEGDHPFTDIEDSRMNLNENGKIWGTWFKDDLPNGFEWATWASAWSVIHLTKTDDLHSETFWKYLEQHPGLSGLFIEANRLASVGQSLYAGKPYGRSGYYIVSGDESSGIAKMDHLSSPRADGPHTKYVRFHVTGSPQNIFGDILTLEVFDGYETAKSNEFSDKAVRFRRSPCRTNNCD